MNNSFSNIFLFFIFSCAYSAGAIYWFFIVWYKFPELQAKLIERNEKRITGKWSFAYLANVWLRHGSYKWFARIASLLLLLGASSTIIVSLYALLSLIR